MNSVINLDKLKAESQKVQFLEKEFEVGYIPCGAGIPIIEAYQETMQHKEENGKAEFVDKVVRLISLFCSFTEPDFTPEFIKANASNMQVSSFFELIATAIVNNFSHVMQGEENESSDDVNSEKKKTGEKQ